MTEETQPHFLNINKEQLKNPSALSPFIEHTLLKADARQAEVIKLADEAMAFGFWGACVNVCQLKTLLKALGNSAVRAVAVVGFPLGATLPEVKAFEAHKAIEAGAAEVDMVMNIGALKDGDYAWVSKDIACVVEAARGACTKVIIETGLLTEREKEAACLLSKSSGAHFVKTCTGFAGGKATQADVALMRRVVGSGMGVKASGGICTFEEAVALLLAGANRLGTSSGAKLVKGGW
ncbi:MAG: deoxyribose-phosphate aldolase [Cystobacterineae bacterium]|nr:deoxyribose-phosphate aldolase [Cystobacterineae bacterium]